MEVLSAFTQRGVRSLGRVKKNKRKTTVSGLKMKMIVMLIVFITIPSAIIGVYSNVSSSNALQNLMEDKLSETVSDKKVILEQMLNGVSVFGKTLSRNYEVIDSMKENSVKRIWLFRYLKQVGEDNKKLIESLVIVDQNGQSIVTSNSVSADIDLSDRDYVQKALSKGEESWSSLIVSRTTGKPTIAIAHPVIQEGKTIGAIIATVNFEMIVDELKTINLGNLGHPLLLDQRGLVAYHPNQEVILKHIDDLSVADDQRQILDDMAQGASGEGYYESENGRVYTQYIGNSMFSLGLNINIEEYMQVSKNINNITLFIILTSVLVSIACAYVLVNRNVVNPLLQLKSLMTKAGSGDFRERSEIHTGDEIEDLGKIYNDMIDNQSRIIQEIRKNAIALSSSSQTLYSQSLEMDSIAENIEEEMTLIAEHASNENEELIITTGMIEDLDNQIKKIADFTHNAERYTNETGEHANRGREKVKNAVQAIDTIKVSAEGINAVLCNLSETSNKVVGIVKTINNISSKTNLLALNANIEAARVGEYGRGFAVVADEIRQLSDQTNDESEGINQLVEEIKQVIKEALESINATMNEIVKGSDIVNDTDRTLVKIIDAVKNISDDTSEMANETRKESETSSTIQTKIQNTLESTRVMKENCKSISSASSSQKEMILNLGSKVGTTSKMAIEMLEMVESFKL